MKEIEKEQETKIELTEKISIIKPYPRCVQNAIDKSLEKLKDSLKIMGDR